MNGGPQLWSPLPERAAASAIDRLRSLVCSRHGVKLADTTELHRWSVENLSDFWSAVWDDTGVIGEKGSIPFAPGESMPDARFFPEAQLSLAENLLDGRGAHGEDPAIIYRREDGVGRTLSWDQLRLEVAALAAAWRDRGIGSGDRVAAWMPNSPETVIALLAANAIGAIFTSTSADFGATGVLDRFGQLAPRVLMACDGYLYGGKAYPRLGQLREIVEGLPSLEEVVVVPVLDHEANPADIPHATLYRQRIAPFLGLPLEPVRHGFDHPVYILFSSGTTGRPKCIVHRAGGVLLKHLQEQQHHCDVRAGDRLFYYTTCGWMMWNWLVSGLATGATIVLFDGNPFTPRPSALFDLVDEVGISLLGVSAKYIDAIAEAGISPKTSHRLDSLRTMTSTGSPLSPEGFEYVYREVKSDLHLASMSGGTDLCGCLVGGDPTKPVHAGEIQGPSLGMDMAVLDEGGEAITETAGELVCRKPFPSMPLTFWGEGGDEKYREAYFSKYANVWTHGDFALVTARGGYVILGRSDATLNSGGVRIGTAEIYRIVEGFPEVSEAVAVGRREGHDTKVVLFVRLAAGHDLTDELVARIRTRLKEDISPRHVPDVIAGVEDIPRTRSGKVSELAVAAVVNGDEVKNLEALANPESLRLYR